MNRRKFLGLIPLLWLSQMARAAWRDFPYAPNPGWMKLFFKRYWDYHNAKWFNHDKVWPAKLKSGLFAQIALPRDFRQRLPNGKLWPQFAWGYEVCPEMNASWVEWFDLEKPADLRALWCQSFPKAPSKDWCGLTWDVKNQTVIYHTLARDLNACEVQVTKGEYDRFCFLSRVFQQDREIAKECTLFNKKGLLFETYRGQTLVSKRRFLNRFLDNSDACTATMDFEMKIENEFNLPAYTAVFYVGSERRTLFYP